MKLNRSTSHAIRILIECARTKDRLVKVADLAERLQITPQNVFKIVHLLSRAELVVGLRGRHGGVQLAREARSIRVGDIVRAMECPEIELSGDVSRPADEQVTADVNQLFDDALEAFIAILNQQSLEDLAAQSKTSIRPAHRSDARLVSHPRAAAATRQRRRVEKRAARGG